MSHLQNTIALPRQPSSPEVFLTNEVNISFSRRRQADAEAALYGARGKEAALRGGAVVALCWELAALQDTYILEGDYDLKIMRHEYYLQQQKKVSAQ